MTDGPIAEAPKGIRLSNVMGGLLLAGILGVVSTLIEVNVTLAKQGQAFEDLNSKVEDVRKETSAVNEKLPTMAREVDKQGLRLDDHERRILELESVRRLK